MLPFFVFLLSSYSVNYGYAYLRDYIGFNCPNFDLLSDSRKNYVLKNIIKGLYLPVLVVCGGILLGPSALKLRTFNNTIIRCLAGMYVSNDLIGLYRVEELPTTTKMHHSISLVFLFIAWVVDFQTNNFAQLLLFYCYFSAISFPVNLYLGLRLCYSEPLPRLRSIAKWSYLVCLLINWWLQFSLIEYSTDTLAYLFLLLFIVYDDIILLRWLWLGKRRTN